MVQSKRDETVTTMTLRELRAMNLSKDAPRIGNTDAIDPTKYYDYINSLLEQRWKRD